MADDPAARPRRRRFSPEYKLAILAEYDRLTEPGDKGALLRREGLYTSHIVEWRRARDAGALSGLAAQARRPRRTAEQVEPGAGAPPQPAVGGRVGTHEGGVGDRGESTRALGAALRERGQRAAVEQVTGAALEELVPLVRTRRACALVGLPRASLYRRRRPAAPPTSRPRPAPPNALTPAERQQLLEVLHQPRFCDLPPAQVWARLLDEGTYLASISTMYRLLRAHGESRDRRRQRTHPATAKPQLLARKPNDVWSWDITKLPGPSRHEFYDLYVILDIYSRYAPGWLVAPGESAELAEAFIASTIAGVGAAPGVLHADRGSSMTSKPVAQLLVDLGVVRSHSRPHVSDDNPYSEAQFKTLKYCPAFPERFGSIHDARAFCAAFFDAYNHEHRHAALGLHTPASVYYDTAPQIRAHRAIVLDQAYAANPQRFARPPTPPRLPTVAWINQPTPEALIQTR